MVSESLAKSMAFLGFQLQLSNQRATNPYLTMAETSNSIKIDVRNKFLLYSGIVKGSNPICMYSQIQSKHVVTAHILPRSVSNETKNNLHILNIDDSRNLLWLCEGIEQAFDRLKLSFIPCLADGLKARYKMKIWDDECLDWQLVRNKDTTIREVFQESKYLDFDIRSSSGTIKSHLFYRRCLANQAILCHKYHLSVYPEQVNQWGDFSSLTGEQCLLLNKNEYADSEMIIVKELAEEEAEKEWGDETAYNLLSQGQCAEITILTDRGEHNRVVCQRCGNDHETPTCLYRGFCFKCKKRGHKKKLCPLKTSV